MTVMVLSSQEILQGLKVSRHPNQWFPQNSLRERNGLTTPVAWCKKKNYLQAE